MLAYTTGLDSFKGLVKENARINAELEVAQTREFAQQQLDEVQAQGIRDAQQNPM
jgi:hypothetical protein